VALRSLRALPDPGLTTGAVHGRDPLDVPGATRRLALALLPCVAVGVWNTGHQAHASLARLGDAAPVGWRGEVVRALGMPLASDAPWACALHGALFLVPLLAVALAVTTFWEELFARVRRRRRVTGCLTVALLFTLLLPPATPPLQAAFALSLGVVLGKEVFGGTGMGIAHPALVGYVFLQLAWPAALRGDSVWDGLQGYAGSAVFGQVAAAGVHSLAQAGPTWTEAFLGREQGGLGTTSALACLVGGAFLTWRGLVSWRLVVGVALGTLAGALFFRVSGLPVGPLAELSGTWHLVLGSLAFGAIFLATDAPTAPLTHGGRWLCGLLTGFVVVLIRVANPLHPDGVAFAILLGNVFAPLLDQGVVWLHVRRREARRG
jgi:Na+-transporting NADH:ubiquinone oxidoreductase subunit B